MKNPVQRIRSSKVRRVPKVPPCAHIDPDAFRLARGRAVLTRTAAGAFLGVTERTIRNWEEGRSKIPYAAFKLLRCYSGFELPHPSWEGFTFHKDTLWSPDRRAYRADDLGQLGVILAKARYWSQDYERRRPSLSPLPLPPYNVIRFPGGRSVERASMAAPVEVAGAEKRPEQRVAAGRGEKMVLSVAPN